MGYTVIMSDEIPVGDLMYVSSKRASEISGYAQDYIGQLARKGLIDAKRVGGLWYVYLDSLESYKVQPGLPQQTLSEDHASQSDPDVLVSFDGKDYISANRASKLTGYNQDYVGQLARSGKILARQVGNRWYVDHTGILLHKKEKDELLASVQVAAVGIQSREKMSKTADGEDPKEMPLLNYIAEVGDLSPQIRKVDEKPLLSINSFHTPSEHVTNLKNNDNEVPIYINKMNSFKEGHHESTQLHYSRSVNTNYIGTKRPLRLSKGMILTLSAVVISISFLSYGIYRAYGQPQLNVALVGSTTISGGSNFVITIANEIERIISPDLTYERKN
jgi:hypothetical protein